MRDRQEMNRKIISAIIMSSCLLGSAQASDNRTAPNVFSSGSTISSSKMNENFNFLASEMREKSVYCNNGETISDAINAGYNLLTIYGTCDGAIMVYKFDPIPFGINFSDMSNKPISHLIIKGGDADRAATITNTAGGMNSMVVRGGFLQLYNITFNDQLNVSEGSMLFASEVNYEVLNDQDASMGVYGNSYLAIRNSSISAEVRISASVVDIKSSTLNSAESDGEAFSLERNSHGELEESTVNGKISLWQSSTLDEKNSTINCSATYSCIVSNNSGLAMSGTTITCSDTTSTCVSVSNSSHLNLNDATITGGQYNAIELSYSSSGEIRDTTITANGTTGGINLRKNSSLRVENTNVQTSDGTALYVNNFSSIEINNSTFSRTNFSSDNSTPTVSAGSFAILDVWGASSALEYLSCYGGNISVNIGQEVTASPTTSGCD